LGVEQNVKPWQIQNIGTNCASKTKRGDWLKMGCKLKDCFEVVQTNYRNDGKKQSDI
jgi:hypothetical protein